VLMRWWRRLRQRSTLCQRHLRLRRDLVPEWLLLREHLHDAVADELRDRRGRVRYL